MTNSFSQPLPNIREKVKVEKKFRKLNHTELNNEIMKVIKTDSKVDSLENLLGNLVALETALNANEDTTGNVNVELGSL